VVQIESVVDVAATNVQEADATFELFPDTFALALGFAEFLVVGHQRHPSLW